MTLTLASAPVPTSRFWPGLIYDDRPIPTQSDHSHPGSSVPKSRYREIGFEHRRALEFRTNGNTAPCVAEVEIPSRKFTQVGKVPFF